MKMLLPYLMLVSVALTYNASVPSAVLHQTLVNSTPGWISKPCGYRDGRCIVHYLVCPKDIPWMK